MLHKAWTAALFVFYTHAVFLVVCQVDRAMRQIFGRKLLARDLETASRFSDSANLDCITLDGDEANRKGSMQGGYHDTSQSKLAQVMAIREAKAQVLSLSSHVHGLSSLPFTAEHRR